jgi:hypothetical protein
MKSEILIGIICILVGISVLYLTLRYPPKSEFGLLPTANGVIGGILIIIIGVIYLVGP